VHSLIKWFARGLVPMVPGNLEATGDVIATETSTKCLCKAVMGDWGGERNPIWHIAAGRAAPRMMELIDFVYEQFAARPEWRKKGIPRPRMVSREEFDGFVGAVDGAGRVTLAQALKSINRFLPDLLYPKTYDTTRAEKLWGGPLPLYDWRETLGRVIRSDFP
jgi:hypothetical protein